MLRSKLALMLVMTLGFAVRAQSLPMPLRFGSVVGVEQDLSTRRVTVTLSQLLADGGETIGSIPIATDTVLTLGGRPVVVVKNDAAMTVDFCLAKDCDTRGFVRLAMDTMTRRPLVSPNPQGVTVFELWTLHDLKLDALVSQMSTETPALWADAVASRSFASGTSWTINASGSKADLDRLVRTVWESCRRTGHDCVLSGDKL